MEKKPLTNAFADLIKWITGSKSLGWPVGDDQPGEKKKPSGKIIIEIDKKRSVHLIEHQWARIYL